MQFNKLIFLLSMMIQTLAWARGGDSVIVGNGAGLAENNIQFAYQNLFKIAQYCSLAPSICRLNGEDEILAIKKIYIVMNNNIGKPNKIDYLNNEDFLQRTTESHRIAFTGLNPESSIFFNRDKLYDQNGNQLLDVGTAISILTHEAGHQAGISNHNFLDALGAKMKIVFEQKAQNFFHIYEANDGTESVAVQNITIFSTFQGRMADEIMVSNGFESEILTAKIYEKLFLENPYLAGFKIFNPTFIFDFPSNPSDEIKFECMIRAQIIAPDSEHSAPRFRYYKLKLKFQKGVAAPVNLILESAWE